MVFTKVKFAKITKEKKNEVKNYKLCWGSRYSYLLLFFLRRWF